MVDKKKMSLSTYERFFDIYVFQYSWNIFSFAYLVRAVVAIMHLGVGPNDICLTNTGVSNKVFFKVNIELI